MDKEQLFFVKEVPTGSYIQTLYKGGVGGTYKITELQDSARTVRAYDIDGKVARLWPHFSCRIVNEPLHHKCPE